ncbi:MAG TPA: signal peptidase I [Catenuloplanes sp.]|jgi:signal peptidase I
MSTANRTVVPDGAALTDPWSRRAARALLRRAVRGRRERGSDWGEAMLAEFEETTGWESVHWSLSATLASWRERRNRRSLLAAGLGALLPRRRNARLAVAGVLLVALTAGLLRFVVSPLYIPSGSMEPTLLIGSRYVVDRVAFRLTGLERGDIVTHGDADRRFTKRILGVGGDAIDCANGVLRRNGQPVNEPYLTPGTVTDCRSITVPPDSLYLLGDHREVSVDSRHNGPVDKDAVTGRLVVRFWPLT